MSLNIGDFVSYGITPYGDGVVKEINGGKVLVEYTYLGGAKEEVLLDSNDKRLKVTKERWIQGKN